MKQLTKLLKFFPSSESEVFSMVEEPEVKSPLVENVIAETDCILALIGTGGCGKRLEMKFKEKENSNNYLNRVKLLSGQEYSLFPESVWNNELAKLIFQMYQDEGFQNELFQNRQRIPFLESINYFTDKKNSSRLLKNDFQLNFDDFFFASRKTTGISPFKYVNNHKKAIIDTGGQRTERSKWNRLHNTYSQKLHIGFVISLSEFDELCYEDDITPRFNEGLSNFEEWYGSPLVSEHTLYLIFSKFEVLEEKIKKGISFSRFVSEFKGDETSIESIVEFIVKKYLELDVKRRVVKYYVISAFKTEQVYQMLNEIFEI
ncbi:predicted protein [Naegleria gruberi]|uniref:Predicted protein n=1 Tax=Naegleria gruberi TaxID=5762 RepID=D2W3S6_NAEGR|nr:uncharacterized protein NAEGRDRAFT_76050 [Naegleria gruberi]EFC36315.1 predicted protein [Naegleria gruberi]|eukprot:XP_002669059.1 predicted protein [Naegleria gruberi strain NEG-M]